MDIQYYRGSKGVEVEKIQTRLKELGFYQGPIDGIFGGGTESAVKRFQISDHIVANGVVDAPTWSALFDGDTIPEPEILKKTLDFRCLALTGSFETDSHPPECFSGITGDFDGQGMSFGALQWNFGQQSLQPLLMEMNQQHRDLFKNIFSSEYDVLLHVLDESLDQQMIWVRSIQDNIRHTINEPWNGLFKALGRTSEFQEIQLKEAGNIYQTALDWCNQYQLWTERGVALMFDIRVQNGSIPNYVKQQILNDFSHISTQLSAEEKEVAMMQIIANRRAEASNPKYIEDVRKRKLCCALGNGQVHGQCYNLEQQYGITLKKWGSS